MRNLKKMDECRHSVLRHDNDAHFMHQRKRQPCTQSDTSQSYYLVADEYKEAGVEATVFVEPGVPHAYNIILCNTPQTTRLKDFRDNAVKQMFN